MSCSSPGLDEHLLKQLVGESPRFKEAIALIGRFAKSKAPLLIMGETGTGKELAAHAGHYLSERRNAAFVPLNCGAMPDALFESELFGHAKGAFTDAARSRSGLIRQAEGGTLFLDEVEALSPRGQVVLLRFLQDQAYRALGEEQLRQADVRVIAASNVNLRQMVSRGEFRADLLFRLDVLSVELPPLRERLEDLPALAQHLLAKAAASEGGVAKPLSPAALAQLLSHDWPGNVRELAHVLLRAHLLGAGPCIQAADLQRCGLGVAPELAWQPGRLREQKLLAVLQVERRFVDGAMALSKGNISAAARLCHMERAAFSKMVKKCRSPEA
ncbi:transcriptional regulator with PAS, ATPase and Fis domain [Paucibacter oligotrophus]|uniref:Transcriptional regulator with PAS, ATPase and Fis domain n=1 Tax=Roseateles oligotrophus TaxID=1769250 RepID=A0A840L9X8_9BURK|nr:sigma-54 dependent transcriptional regulator [Roseateles oligotrophus]MBB4842929.1 transcriptional regulator with PAS, ATPase and Fis domain [Roseateles oligotrophus]